MAEINPLAYPVYSEWLAARAKKNANLTFRPDLQTPAHYPNAPLSFICVK